MTSIRFGNAFPIQYNRQTGPKTGERHLSSQPLKRQLQILKLEGEVDHHLTLSAEIFGKMQAKVVQTGYGDYLLTDGPQCKTVTEYDRLVKESAMEKRTLEEALDLTTSMEEKLFTQGLLEDGSPTLVSDYRVGKNAQSGFLFPKLDQASYGKINALFRDLQQKASNHNLD